MINNNVFVCGGGHQGLSMAAHLSLNDVKVTLWNRTLDNIKEVINTKEIVCQGVVSGTAKIENASDDISEVISDFIMVTTPSNSHKEIAKRLAPFVHKDMIIVLNPGRTFGAVEFARSLIDYGACELPHIAETQTIVYTCRRGEGNSTRILALKRNVKIAAIRGSDIRYILELMPDCLKQYYEIAESILVTSLTNVGMVLHCAPVLMNIGWIESTVSDFKYYYEGISKTVADFLEKIDYERQLVAYAAGCPIESVTEWLRRTYNVKGSNIYECLRDNVSYREIDAPRTIDCRYLNEDIPNGLVPIEALGKELGVSTPNISIIIDLASSVLNYDFRKTGRCFSLEMINQYV